MGPQAGLHWCCERGYRDGSYFQEEMLILPSPIFHLQQGRGGFSLTFQRFYSQLHPITALVPSDKAKPSHCQEVLSLPCPQHLGEACTHLCLWFTSVLMRQGRWTPRERWTLHCFLEEKAATAPLRILSPQNTGLQANVWQSDFSVSTEGTACKQMLYLVFSPLEGIRFLPSHGLNF